MECGSRAVRSGSCKSQSVVDSPPHQQEVRNSGGGGLYPHRRRTAGGMQPRLMTQDAFYHLLSQVLAKVAPQVRVTLLGDINVQVGHDTNTWVGLIGRHEPHQLNNNRRRLQEHLSSPWTCNHQQAFPALAHLHIIDARQVQAIPPARLYSDGTTGAGLCPKHQNLSSVRCTCHLSTVVMGIYPGPH